MKRGMNRKGEDSGPAGNVGVIIIVAVVVVLIIVAVYMFSGKIFGIERLSPSDLSALVAACEGYSRMPQLKIDYCSFKDVEVGSSREFINCEDKRIQDVMAQEYKGQYTCGENATLDECKTLLRQGIKNPVVVGQGRVECIKQFKKCVDFGANDTIDGSCKSPTTRSITIQGESENTICCVAPQ